MAVTEFKPIIKVIEEAYEIPQLQATRKISALLPHDYYETDKHYPVLYLQDGQNLFDPRAPYGDWAIDKSLGTELLPILKIRGLEAVLWAD